MLDHRPGYDLKVIDYDVRLVFCNVLFMLGPADEIIVNDSGGTGLTTSAG
ncbi:unnamed protein product [marine sediment metagenome]|uniref:Uncharacterized protein n=1 Tax=marine sediment metagenome TaxID=412755 RepID=X1MG46_9ZZZZ